MKLKPAAIIGGAIEGTLLTILYTNGIPWWGILTAFTIGLVQFVAGMKSVDDEYYERRG